MKTRLKILAMVMLASLSTATSMALPPFDPTDPRPPGEDERHCVFDNVECVREFHVFTGVVTVIARCIKEPCRAYYVKAGDVLSGHRHELRTGDVLYLEDLELFVWDGAGYGSVTMLQHGSYIILNRELDPVVPRCQF